jgi:ABC-2 type transport system permease protein
MDTDTNAATGPVLETAAPAPLLSSTRPLYWSVRRELWENRSLYVVPLAVAGVVLFSYLVGSIGLPGRLRAAAALDPAQQQVKLGGPFSMAAAVVILFTYVAAAFYCLDALYGERRDRSILFWKSLPVSDLTTVLAKLCVPLAVVPALAFVVALATQVAMLLYGTFVALMTGLSPAPLWTRVPLVEMTFVMLYGLVVHALWHAPLYAWLLLLSAFAPRLPILWAVLPPMGVAAFERLTFGTSHFCTFMQYRLIGTLQTAFDYKAGGGHVPVLRPLQFLLTPGLWLGLVVAALFLAAAVRLRRRREPI